MIAKILTAVLFYFLYWFCCFLCTGTDKKNLAGLRSYPDEVQAIVRAEPSLEKCLPKERSIWTILSGNLLLCTVIFSILGIALKGVLALTSYRTAFFYFLLFGEGLGLFDLLIIDLLWWRNTRRIRFSFLPDWGLYRNPSKHIGSFVRGIPLFALVAAITAWIVTAIPL